MFSFVLNDAAHCGDDLLAIKTDCF